jgi:uncharacterized protein YbjQ (UPF0145 family)
MEAAQELGANAVVGVDIDYETLGEKNGMLMVSISGKEDPERNGSLSPQEP